MEKEKAMIRAYEARDKNALLELFRLNSPQYFAPEEEKDLIYYLDHEIESYFVMEINATIIGCGGFNFSGNTAHGKISWDILHPDFQGKGFGSILLNYRIQKLKESEGLETITVRTSQLAYHFYEKAGFQLIEKKENYWAKGFDLYKMIYTK